MSIVTVSQQHHTLVLTHSLTALLHISPAMSPAPPTGLLIIIPIPVNQRDTQTACVLLLHHLKDADLTLLLSSLDP